MPATSPVLPLDAATTALATTGPCARPALLPLGALLLAGSVSAWAQSPTPGATTTAGDAAASATLPTVTVQGSSQADSPGAKTSLRTKTSRIGKGEQALRDIPQSVTVMTEHLIDDRNLDDFREVLKTTAGVTFQAGETGEEDVRLRGFSLGQAGDIYVDGLKDAALIERDTFNHDRVEVLKGSASMLFGKGSTGGVVNQVSKQPFLMTQHEADLTVGSGQEVRATGDFNIQTSPDSALRINALHHEADNHGASVNKKGIAPTFRWGIGLRDEFSAGLYYLETDGVPLYNHPWYTSNGKIVPTLPAKNYYGLASDHLQTRSAYATLSHTHRFDQDTTLKTTLRHGNYERDLWASVVRFGQTNGAATNFENRHNDNTPITRTPKGRVGSSELTQLQSDLSNKFEAWGKKHELIAGVDVSYENARRNNSFAGSASGLTTTVGTPNDGAWRPDDRGDPVLNSFKSQTIGVYAQDTVSITDQVKLLGGLRVDRFSTKNRTNTCDPVQSIEIEDTLLSPRLGVIYQPSEVASYYASFGSSFNTSGDTYAHGINICNTAGSNNEKLLNTAPEKSRNFEIGGKFELFEQKASLGVALFHSEKYNERNTDEPTADSYLLSGKRHATGMEFNLAGRITPKWEVFYNHTWIPTAKIDSGRPAGSTGNAQQEGDRPALTPKHSASLWTTYRVLPKLRVGAGLNYRGEQSPEGARQVVAPSFTTVDAMAEYNVTDATSLKLNVTNLTDKLYADSLYRGFYAPGAPRAVQLTLKTLF